MQTMWNNPMMVQITELSFAMDELRLFLDTHPDCREALIRMNELQKQRCDAVAAWEAQCGPLSSYGNMDCDEWKWVQGPWPWQNY